MIRIAMVAGEPSGDVLGAGLIKAIRAQCPNNLVFEGIGGSAMQAQGFDSFVPMEQLSVMGLIEVLGSLKKLLAIRKQLYKKWCENPPDIFIGIDAPDFNLTLEAKLHAQGILTAHYVSPSVWAWRQGRVKTIRKAVDLILTLFPFETDFYQQHHVPVCYVGHPLADQIPLHTEQATARQLLHLPLQTSIIALLPGSRSGEIKYIAPLLIETALLIKQQRPDTLFIMPAVNAQRQAQLESLLADYGQPSCIQLVKGQAQTVMAAAEAIVLASGTATLEAMLIKRPMVVVYKMAAVTAKILLSWVKLPYYSLPNLLAQEKLVPELIQNAAQPKLIAQTLLAQLDNPSQRQRQMEKFSQLHQQLKRDADQTAAAAVLNLIGSHPNPPSFVGEGRKGV